MIDKKNLSERDICTKFIAPALEQAGWNKLTQLLEEVSFTDGKIYVRGQLTARGKQKRADYISLPPLAEQTRIVQKLDELMQYCNDLEASIKQSETQNEKLLQQVLREAFSQLRNARGKEVVGV
jgi:type I site-specific restriction endonuclease